MEMPHFHERKEFSVFFGLGKYTDIIVDKKNVCKEKKTETKHLILFNGNAYKLPSLKSE